MTKARGETSPSPHRAGEAALLARGISVRYGAPDGSGASRAAPPAPTAAHGGTTVLTDVDLTVQTGELVAVLGPNGAGKTTLLRVLAGTLAPTKGDVRLFDAPLAELARRDVARQLAVVGQSERVVFGHRVRDVVMMGRAPHQGGWLRPSDADAAIVDEVLAACDLLPLADRRADALSGGEQKRMQIARALAQRPRVLLLDEPAAFLDVRHQLAVHELLARRVEEEHIACVVVMHDLALAARYATRVALLAGGRVVGLGRPEDVLTTERLAEAFDVTIDVGVHEASGTRFFVARS